MKIKIFYIISLLSASFLQISCKKYLEIDVPRENLTTENAFANDDLASAAMAGIYSKMSVGMGGTSVHVLCGLSADEFKHYSLNLAEFYENQLSPINAGNNSIFINYYAYAYAANAVMDGIGASTGLTPSVQSQLKGEALFIRAFSHFYLVNLFGPIPLQLTTDYRINRKGYRSTVEKVYEQIILDLETASNFLTDEYYTKDKVRPNLAAVQALLARVYLFKKDWKNAEKYSSMVISKSTVYKLSTLNAVFLKNSAEAIWQLFPPVSYGNTVEGSFFILAATPTNVSLQDNFVSNAFEANDKRRTSWIGSYTNKNLTYYFPNKYKIRLSPEVSEYSMVLRLSEQYLIRAEARAQQSDLSNAIDDLDMIRDRAGLPLIKATSPGISQQDLLTAIQKERRVELFSEWGHRWLDLKRTGTAGDILQQIKPHWQNTDVLYPIPYNETSRNPNVTQNEGY
ncbi:RagB/SusD family nutrient uptake outer membrane protein [Pedobacter psychroterrae]|nr:RagB/SusD family nutrient uptake outer membrane protein [Pedobacter psychroterrae]